MQIISKVNKHSKAVALLAISKGFERAAYYGIRAVMVLYLIGETINLSTGEALSIYGTYTMGVMIFGVVGAVLGDVLFGNRKAIFIGGVLSILGCSLLCIESLQWLKIGLGLLALGTGLYASNMIARFGKEYLDKKELLDAGFSIHYSATNVGAFVGTLVIGYLSNYNFKYGMLLGIGFLVLAMLFVYLVKKSPNLEIKSVSTQISISNYKYIVIVVLLVGCFWMIYELGYFGVIEVQQRILTVISEDIPDVIRSSSFSSSASMIALMGFAFLWSYYYGNQFLKLFIGVLIFALALFILSVIPTEVGEGGMSLFLVVIILMAIGESLITPLIASITVKYANPKYLTIILAIATLPSLGFNKLSGILAEKSVDYELNVVLIYCAMALMFIALIAYLFFRKTKKEEGALLTKEAEAFLKS